MHFTQSIKEKSSGLVTWIAENGVPIIEQASQLIKEFVKDMTPIVKDKLGLFRERILDFHDLLHLTVVDFFNQFPQVWL